MNPAIANASDDELIAEVKSRFGIELVPRQSEPPERIRFKTGRWYSEQGQRIGAERIPQGIIFADVDRMIDGFIPNPTLENYGLELDQPSVMQVYDYQLCEYWVGTYDYEAKLKALREWTKELA